MAEYIEREALMKNFCGYDLTKCVKYGNKDADQRHGSYSTMMMYEIADEIIDAPAADVAPVVHGDWMEWFPGDCALIMTGEEMLYRCSCCDVKYSDAEGYKYCPNCGAKMDLEEPNEAKESRQP